MKWPWVPREQLDAVEADNAQLVEHLLAQLASLREEVKAERARVESLTNEIIRMRREGFVPQPEPPTPEETTPLPPAVLDAIDQRAFDGPSRRQLRKVAEQLIRVDRAEKDIVKAILDGEQFDEEEFV